MFECFFFGLFLGQCRLFAFLFLLALQFPLLCTLLAFFQLTLTLELTHFLVGTELFQLFQRLRFLVFELEVLNGLLPAETALFPDFDCDGFTLSAGTRATPYLQFANRPALERDFSGTLFRRGDAGLALAMLAAQVTQ